MRTPLVHQRRDNMEQGLKEYFAKLSKNFWQPNNNPKIKYELGYRDELPGNDMSWLFKFFQRPYQPEEDDIVFSLSFYRFYKDLLEDEPDMIDFIKTIPFSYHKILIDKCSDAYEALTIIAKAIENDWAKYELINYFSLSRN